MTDKAEYIKKIYQNHFESENGRIILEDLEKEILVKSPFYTENLQEDALLREGARQLLNYIYFLIDKTN